MSVNIFHKTGSGTGTLQKVAGNTVILDATTSEKRDWTVTISCTANTYSTGAVTFDVPMPDTDYCVLIETCNHQEAFEKGWTITNKTVNGFTLQIYSSNTLNATFTGYAFKLITMDGYTELQNKVENPDNVPTQNSDNLVKSGGVWEALKDAGTVFTGTKSEWENLNPTEQERYEVVCITDDEESGIVDEYSTTETKTNKVWFNRKPIYRKVYNVDVNTYTDQDSRRTFTYIINDDIESIVATGGCWIVKSAPTRPEIVGWTQTWGAAQMNTGGGVEYASTSLATSLPLRMLTNLWGGVEAVTLNVWIEYTKTN